VLVAEQAGREMPGVVYFSFAVSFANVAFAETQKENPYATRYYVRV
jgi:hypothetical protein